MEQIIVTSPCVSYTPQTIHSKYVYHSVRTSTSRDPLTNAPLTHAYPYTTTYRFKTSRQIPKVGVLLVGLGGNNGTTTLAGILANRNNLEWRVKGGVQRANWFGSLLLSGTVKLGIDASSGSEKYIPISSLLPLCKPESLAIGGWDISDTPAGDAMRRSGVLDVDLQDKLYEAMQQYHPLKSVYFPGFIADNQANRANNVLEGSKEQQLKRVREQIMEFKLSNQLDKVIVLWTATTERFVEVIRGVNDTAESLMNAIAEGHEEIAPSTIYAVASILEGCSYINGSPQNTFVPGLVELAKMKRVFIGGDDFKSGQTKFKSALVDYLVSSGMKVGCIASYNHLGNNDGLNLSSPPQLRSKEISKSSVIDDIIASNKILYPNNGPDHTVVIKYMPFVGDSKRALDEYSSDIFLGGVNTIVVHNTCEDSLLAAPLIIDMLLLTELLQRVEITKEEDSKEVNECVQAGGVSPSKEAVEDRYDHLHPVLSMLSYMCKAPMVPAGSPVINSLHQQRACITNFLKACVGLPPDNHMLLEFKTFH